MTVKTTARMACCAVLLLATTGIAVADTGPAGFWSGTIEVPNRPIEVMIDIAQEHDAWTAAVYVPAQGIRGAAMTGVAIDGGSVTMQIPGVPGEPTFRGELAEGGQTIAGTFNQGGQSLPFQLSRTEKPAELSRDIYAEFREPGVAGAGAEGTWRGLLEAGPHQFRLVLEVEQDSFGETVASLRSLDQGGEPLPVDTFSFEDTAVAFALPAISAEFTGTLSADGSEIVGTWAQGGGQLPLTLRRASE